MPETTTRSRFRRGSALVAGMTAAVLTLAACAGPSDSTGGSTNGSEGLGELTVQLSWIKNVEFAGEYFADDQGYFEEAGFSSVNLIAGPGATESQVASGASLIGVTDPISTAPAIINEGAPLKIIATTYQKNPFSILSLTDKANIKTPKDLIGKRIGVQSGNDTLFQALLEANGIDKSQVTVVPVEYDPSPLTTGDVDGFLAYVTNESIILESQGYKVTNLLYADNGLPFVTESFITTDDAIANNRDALKGYLKAMIKGWKDALADPEEAARLATEVYGADLGLDYDVQLKQAIAAEALIVTADTDANGLFTMTDELIQENLKVLAKTGVEITADQLFDLSLLEEVYAENPDLK